MPCANDKNCVFPHSFCILCSPPSVTKWPFSYATVSLNSSKRTFVLCAINRECWRDFGMLNYWLLLSFSYHQCIPGSGKYLIWWFQADFCTLFSQLLFSIAVSFFRFFFFFFFVFPVLFFSSGVCISSFYVLRSFFLSLCVLLLFFFLSVVCCQSKFVHCFGMSLQWCRTRLSFICKTRKAPCNWKDTVDTVLEPWHHITLQQNRSTVQGKKQQQQQQHQRPK